MTIVTVRNRSGRVVRMQKRYADILVKTGSHVVVPDDSPQQVPATVAPAPEPNPKAPKKKRGYKRRDMRAEESE